MSSPDPRLRQVAISEAPLDVADVLARVDHPAAGGVGLFVGIVRDHDGGRGVRGLSYSAHPSATAELTRVVQELLTDEVLAVTAVHRVGDLGIGDAAVVTAVACAHRGPALEINTRLIDRIKLEVPVWKHQRFTDGTDEWVGL